MRVSFLVWLERLELPRAQTAVVTKRRCSVKIYLCVFHWLYFWWPVYIGLVLILFLNTNSKFIFESGQNKP